MIAANLVKNAAPDGYTLLLTSNSSHSVNPHMFKKIEYDPIADFTPRQRHRRPALPGGGEPRRAGQDPA